MYAHIGHNLPVLAIFEPGTVAAGSTLSFGIFDCNSNAPQCYGTPSPCPATAAAGSVCLAFTPADTSVYYLFAGSSVSGTSNTFQMRIETQHPASTRGVNLLSNPGVRSAALFTASLLACVFVAHIPRFLLFTLLTSEGRERTSILTALSLVGRPSAPPSLRLCPAPPAPPLTAATDTLAALRVRAVERAPQTAIRMWMCLRSHRPSMQARKHSNCRIGCRQVRGRRTRPSGYSLTHMT